MPLFKKKKRFHSPPLKLWRSKRWLQVSIMLILFLLTFFFLQSWIFKATSVVQRPLVSFGTWISDKTIYHFQSFSISPEEVQEMKTRLEYLAIDHAELEQLRDQNNKLQEQLGFIKRFSDTAISASIISRTSALGNKTFVIDKGTNDGVDIGSAVVVGNGMFVGKVSRTSQSTSTVKLITNNDSATASTLLNITRTIGIAEGMSGNLISLKFIPQDEIIEVNDLVVTSGLEDGVPGGLVIGVVNTVKIDSKTPFQEAVVEPLVDIRRYSHVSIVKK